MKIYFVRHIQTLDDANGMTQSDDSSVSIDAFGLFKLKEIRKIKVDKVLTSPLLRAVQTANLINPEYKIISELAEVKQPKLLEKMTHKERKVWWNKHSKSRIDPDWFFNDSESFNDIKKRVRKLFKKLMNLKSKYKSIMVVTHANILKHLLLYMIKKDYSQKDFYLIYPFCWDNLSVIEMKI